MQLPKKYKRLNNVKIRRVSFFLSSMRDLEKSYIGMDLSRAEANTSALSHGSNDFSECLALENYRCKQWLLGQVSCVHLISNFHWTELKFKPWWFGREMGGHWGKRTTYKPDGILQYFSSSQALLYFAVKHCFGLKDTSDENGSIKISLLNLCREY